MDKLRNSTHKTYAAFACELGLEEMKRVGFFKNAYRNVRKAYFDRRTTQWILLWNQYSLWSKISAVEGNEVRSEEDGTSKQAHVKVGKQTAERLPIKFCK